MNILKLIFYYVLVIINVAAVEQKPYFAHYVEKIRNIPFFDGHVEGAEKAVLFYNEHNICSIVLKLEDKNIDLQLDKKLQI